MNTNEQVEQVEQDEQEIELDVKRVKSLKTDVKAGDRWTDSRSFAAVESAAVE
jgi:hypothetical protein